MELYSIKIHKSSDLIYLVAEDSEQAHKAAMIFCKGKAIDELKIVSEEVVNAKKVLADAGKDDDKSSKKTGQSKNEG